MNDLIERLEKATGPSNRLDVAIWEAIFVSPETFRRVPPPRYTEWQKNDDGVWRDYYADLNAKPYTASIDAALTLVPAGWFWRVGLTSSFQAWAGVNQTHPDHGEPNRNEFFWGREHWQKPDTTPAIALCIAALKARSLVSKNEPGAV